MEELLKKNGTIIAQKIKMKIIKIIKKAKRLGVWNKISRIEKGILSLSSSLQITFKSMRLLRSIVAIVNEITQLMPSKLGNYMRGIKTAYKIAVFAYRSGYQQAINWANDKNYVIWWGMFLNPTVYTK